MPGFDTAEVLQAYDGELFAAPAGAAALPADLSATLDPAFEGVGWLTEDGLTFKPNVSAGDPIKGWPRGEILLRPSASLDPMFTFALAQHSADTLDWMVQPDREMALVLEYRATSTGPKHRLVLPKVKVTETGELPLNVEDLVALEVTVGCSRDDTAGYTFAFDLPGADGTSTVRKSY